MNTLEKSLIFTPLFALDRLNSWLRSDQPWYCPYRSSLKPIIYWTKTQAILETSRKLQIGMRRVAVIKPCRTCDGTGTWVSDREYWRNSWDESFDDDRSNYGERCRKCGGKGKVHLKFIETTIGPIRWHTPSERWAMSSLDVYVPFPSYWPNGDDYYDLATGWEPCQKGRPLSLPEAHRDMLVILLAFPHHVTFSLDFHFGTKLQQRYRVTHIKLAEAWINAFFAEADFQPVAGRQQFPSQSNSENSQADNVSALIKNCPVADLADTGINT